MINMTTDTPYQPVRLPGNPERADFAAWLTNEVDASIARFLQGLIDEEDARWVPDPYNREVWAIKHRNGQILLVTYDYGADFETSTECDDLWMAQR